MNTCKPISTISYNSEDFLLSILREWHFNHIISDYIYIKHFAEDDEKKDHFHLLLVPNTKVDTVSLQEDLRELDPNFPKPLGCIDFCSSKVDDWILYSQHFAPYLASKLEDRKWKYLKEDFRFLDQDTFDEKYRHAFRQSDWAKQSQINTLLSEGISGSELILSGVLPLQNAPALLALANLERQGKLDRNGRPNHEIETID